MNTGPKPRMTKEEIQQIIDNRLAVILEKELQQNEEAIQNGISDVPSTRRRKRQNAK